MSEDTLSAVHHFGTRTANSQDFVAQYVDPVCSEGQLNGYFFCEFLNRSPSADLILTIMLVNNYVVQRFRKPNSNAVFLTKL